MIRAIFFLFSLLSTASAQVQEPLDELTGEFEGKLIAAQLPYKNLNGSFVIHYKTSAHQKLTIETKPKHLVDSVALRSIADQIPEKLYTHLDSVHIWSYFKFDDYTERVFFDKWWNIGVGMFPHSLLLDAEPARGKEAFAERWLGYLYQNIPVDSIRYHEALKDGRWLRFSVGRDGTFQSQGRSADSSLLDAFLRFEQKWKPGIRDGRPVSARVSLFLPTLLPVSHVPKKELEKMVVYDNHVLGMHDKPIFFTADEGIVREDINLISAVNNERKIDAVVYHRGDLKQCQALEAFLRAQDPMKLIMRYQERQFDRFYFYTYKDELEN